MKQQRGPFGLRMPKDLHGWIKAEAEKQGRSMNNLIVHLLREQTPEAKKIKPTVQRRDGID